MVAGSGALGGAGAVMTVGGVGGVRRVAAAGAVRGAPGVSVAPSARTAAWRRARARPQVVAEAAAVAAWALLLAHPLAVAAGVHTHGRPTPASWAVMAAAMMLPAAIPAARHVGINSLRWRRHRAVATFVAAYLAVWVAYGAAVLAAAAVLTGTAGLAGTPGWLPLPLALAAAAAWQVTPWQRTALAACHRTVPLRPSGWPAARSVLRFATRNAGGCVGTCWALMLVMVAAPPATHLAWTLALTVVVAAQKTALRPRRAARAAAWGLAGAAAVSVAGGAAASALGATLVAAATLRAVRR